MLLYSSCIGLFLFNHLHVLSTIQHKWPDIISSMPAKDAIGSRQRATRQEHASATADKLKRLPIGHWSSLGPNTVELHHAIRAGQGT